MAGTARSQRALAVLLVATLALAGLPGVVAAESRAGGSVVVGTDETVNGLQAIGGTVVVRGTVDGDLSGVAGTVVVEGEVTGDVEVSAGSVRISGTVGGDVEAATGSFVLDRSGTVDGTLRVAAGHVAIEGSVGDDVESAADTTVLGPQASIDGDLRYGGDLERADGATVTGEVVRDQSLGVNVGVFDTSILSSLSWALGVYFFLLNAVVGAIALLVMPDFSAALAARAAESPLRSGAVGLATLIGVPVLTVALAITVVGIPFALVSVFLFVLLAWLGYVYGAFALGSRLLEYTEVRNRYGALLVGLIVVALVGRVPWIGGAVEFLVFLLGLGALVLGVYDVARGVRGGESASPDAE